MVEEQKQSMNLNAVRLCFQAFLPDETGAFTKALHPCISNAVYDSSEILYFSLYGKGSGLVIMQSLALI